MPRCPTCRRTFDNAAYCPLHGTRLVADVGPGTVLGGRYQLIQKIGAGGMGEVYEAEHAYVRRRVAVKILRHSIAADPDAVARLQREAHTTSTLGHPNIVDCFDFGYADDGQVYLVMEWLAGENLEQRLLREPVDLESALEIISQTAAALAEAHAHGIVHRDLKPANLFLTVDRAGALLVKVVDFGIAKLVDTPANLSGANLLVGTPNYMAPEQALGETVDGRTDVYGLGVILYELVTGAAPFQAESPLIVIHHHTSTIAVPPSMRAPDRCIAPEIDALVMRCLAKRPADRFASMSELIAAVGAVRRRPAAESRPAGTPRWMLIIAALLLVVAATIIALLILHERKHADDGEHPAPDAGER